MMDQQRMLNDANELEAARKRKSAELVQVQRNVAVAKQNYLNLSAIADCAKATKFMTAEWLGKDNLSSAVKNVSNGGLTSFNALLCSVQTCHQRTETIYPGSKPNGTGLGQWKKAIIGLLCLCKKCRVS